MERRLFATIFSMVFGYQAICGSSLGQREFAGSRLSCGDFPWHGVWRGGQSYWSRAQRVI